MRLPNFKAYFVSKPGREGLYSAEPTNRLLRDHKRSNLSTGVFPRPGPRSWASFLRDGSELSSMSSNLAEWAILGVIKPPLSQVYSRPRDPGQPAWVTGTVLRPVALP